ncbi:MAG: hypothetical protein QF464_12485 [Myxococcota bacterium]|nr:hypothetical protein [Myxococcota bacterium]
MVRLTSPRSLRFALVALFAAGGLLVWGELAPVDGYVGFRVPPSIRTTGGSVRRQELRQLAVVVRSRDGQVVARAEQDMRDGLTGPVTAPISMRLPRGDYLVLATLTVRGGSTASLVGTLALTEDGYHRVDLERPH